MLTCCTRGILKGKRKGRREERTKKMERQIILDPSSYPIRVCSLC